MISPRSRFLLSILILFFGGGVFFAGILHIPKTLAQSPPLGPSLAVQQAGTTNSANTKIMNFVSGCTVTGSGTTASVTCAGTGVSSVTASLPLTSSGGATPNLTIAPAPTTNGRLIYDTGTTYGAITDVATGQVLTSGGITGTPAYSASPSVTTLTGTTSLLTPLLDANTAGALTLGTTTATSIALQQNITMPTGKTLVVGANTLIGSVSDKLNAANLAIASQAVGDLLYANATTTFTRLADVATGSVLTSGGINTAPAWSSSPSVTTLTGTTSILSPLHDVASAGTLSLGTSTATGITMGSGAIVTTVAGTGGLQVAGNFDRSTAAALAIGTVNANAISLGSSGITTTVTGGFTQLTGAVSITGNAASSFTTSSGALTLTGAANSTWSLSQNGTAGGGGFAINEKSGQGGNASNPTAGGAGGFLTFTAGAGGNGDATTAPGGGGTAQLVGGAGGTQNGTGSANGGAANVTGGAGTGTAGNGGNVNIVAGAAAGSGTRGTINICTAGGGGCNNIVIGGFASSTVSYNAAAALLISSTAPTISSGFGTGASVTANNGTAAFRIGVGTSSATTGVIGLPTATTGWNCYCADLTTITAGVFLCKQTASSTTSATLGNFSDTAAATAWTDSDVLAVSCFAY